MAIPNIVAQNSSTKQPNSILDGVIGYDEADYDGGFANYTPPTPSDVDFDIRVAKDTNATTPGKRLYIYAGGAWHYVALT